MSTLSISPAFTAPRSIAHHALDACASRAGAGWSCSSRRWRCLLLAAFFLGSVAVGSETPGQAEPTEIVMVGTGDTLWGIAADINTDGDVRSTMVEIERLNALDSVALSAGQKLRVPVSDD